MNTSVNQVRNSGTILKNAIFLGLLIFPVASLVVPPKPPVAPVVVRLPAGLTGAEIQQALDNLPESGGEVILPPGSFEVDRPIVLERDYQALRGCGAETVLHLADDANCPVIILGEAVNNPQRTVKFLRVADLFIDGNRHGQQRELWQLQGEDSEIHNNGITVQNVTDSVVEHVTCAHCRSGGLVTTRGVSQFTVRDLTAFDNEFDGLACYETTNCLFTDLSLHDNPGAGISLDLAFNHNVISNAVLVANNLGVFMRASCDNQFYNIAIRNSRQYGVFMAHAVEPTANGWQVVPQTECEQNYFINLTAADCGSAAFWINNTTCTNNIIVGARFGDSAQSESLPSHPHWATAR